MRTVHYKKPDLDRADIEREISSARTGFVLLRDYPEFGGSVSLVRKIHTWVADIPVVYATWVDQVERSSVSVPANLAEGHGRGTLAQVLQYVRIARGSCFETRALLLCSPIPVPEDIMSLVAEVCKNIDRTVVVLAEERLGRLGGG